MIERLTACECHYVKKLYELKGMKAVGEAKADHYVSKLTSGVKYTDIYSHRNSLYLSPIPEESDEDVEESDSGVFPSGNNSRLSAMNSPSEQTAIL